MEGYCQLIEVECNPLDPFDVAVSLILPNTPLSLLATMKRAIISLPTRKIPLQRLLHTHLRNINSSIAIDPSSHSPSQSPVFHHPPITPSIPFPPPLKCAYPASPLLSYISIPPLF